MIDTEVEYARMDSGFVREEKLIGRFIEQLDDSDIVWDIGANIGTYSCFAASNVPRGAVIAFEPHPENARKVRKNAALNGYSNISIKKVALSDSNGRVELSLESENVGTGGHTLIPEQSDETVPVESGNEIDVSLVRGDDLVERDLASPNAIKIDVEGVEVAVLNGLSKTLANPDCKYVICEIHKNYGVDPGEVERILESNDFECEILDPHSVGVDSRGKVVFLEARKD
ncbi:FkbM family methyltransferase [Halosolutus gelatinilyticus]|uniref:FkbM family methyltransferase n=1 Tax=Halosolutus gelatinilyticus TaxID=2931975 RepID=UPI001FF5EA0D|nr:FkbM family methyltransferase [Halosolutus gelatinilyticus]